MIDSLVTTIGIYDEVTAQKRSDGRICVHISGEGCEDIPPEANNAVRAAELFVRTFGTGGADITVRKNIPVGAGLGGSSADAAGALNALAALYGIDDGDAVEDIADAVGSDTRYMLRGGWARLSGRGNIVMPVGCTLSPWFVVLVPQGGVSAGQCYRLYDEMCKGAAYSACEEVSDYAGLCKGLYNALYLPAKALFADVGRALKDALTLSPAACMTGSGSAVFAMFESRERALSALKAYGGKFRAFAAGTCLPRTIKGDLHG